MILYIGKFDGSFHGSVLRVSTISYKQSLYHRQFWSQSGVFSTHNFLTKFRNNLGEVSIGFSRVNVKVRTVRKCPFLSTQMAQMQCRFSIQTGQSVSSTVSTEWRFLRYLRPIFFLSNTQTNFTWDDGCAKLLFWLSTHLIRMLSLGNGYNRLLRITALCLHTNELFPIGIPK